MKPTKYQEIYNAFDEYVKTEKKSLIEKYTLTDIEITINQYLLDTGQPAHGDMQMRRDKLIEEKKFEREKKEKWKDRIMGFCFGLLTGIILLIIKEFYFNCRN